MQEKWRVASLAGRLSKERSTVGRRRREGQKGTAALRAAPPLENPAEGRLRRAHREASPRRPCKSPWKAPQTSPSAALQNPAEGRLRRALRRASPRRPCAVSLAGRQGKGRSMTRARGKMWKRVGTARRFAWAGTDARHPVAGERRTKGNGGAARSAAVGKARKRPPRTSPSGSIALAALENPAKSPPQTSPSATLEKPAKGRLRRALRRASPRRPWKSPRCSRPQRGCSRGRSPPRRRRWRRGC